jgi:hypothetical protein
MTWRPLPLCPAANPRCASERHQHNNARPGLDTFADPDLFLRELLDILKANGVSVLEGLSLGMTRLHAIMVARRHCDVTPVCLLGALLLAKTSRAPARM